MNAPITATEAYEKSLAVNATAEKLHSIWGSIRQAMDQGLYLIQTEVPTIALQPILDAVLPAGFVCSYSVSEGGYNLSINWSQTNS